MHIPPELLPVLQITIPLLIGLFVASHSQNKRLDDIVARVIAIEQRLQKIEERLAGMGERITRLEERLPPPLIHQTR